MRSFALHQILYLYQKRTEQLWHQAISISSTYITYTPHNNSAQTLSSYLSVGLTVRYGISCKCCNKLCWQRLAYSKTMSVDRCLGIESAAAVVVTVYFLKTVRQQSLCPLSPIGLYCQYIGDSVVTVMSRKRLNWRRIVEIFYSKPSGDVHCRSEIIIACQFVGQARQLWHWPVPHVLARQEHVDLTEGWPASIVDVAALDKQIVDFARTDTRLRQTQSCPVGCAASTAIQFDVLGNQLWVGEWVIWSTTSETQNLPQRYTERPHITSWCTLSLHTVNEPYCSLVQLSTVHTVGINNLWCSQCLLSETTYLTSLEILFFRIDKRSKHHLKTFLFAQC